MKQAKQRSLLDIRTRRLNFLVSKKSMRKTPSEKLFFRWIYTALDNISKNADISLLLCDEDEAKAYNSQYRNKDYATNVLSFEMGENLTPNLQHQKRLVGDMIICPEVVEKEAREQGKSLYAHYAHLAIHGTLHICGFDHLTDEEAVQMETLEIEILHQLGYENPYNSKEN